MTITRRGALGTLAATTAAALAAPARANMTRIKVGALRFTSHAPSFIALERGYFSDAGLDVDLEFFQAAQPMAVAVAGGDVGYAMTAISGGLINLAGRGAVKVVGGGLSEAVALACWEALRPFGRLVANAVTLESEARLIGLHVQLGGDLVRLDVARAEPVGRFTGWRPSMPVTQWSLVKR